MTQTRATSLVFACTVAAALLALAPAELLAQQQFQGRLQVSTYNIHHGTGNDECTPLSPTVPPQSDCGFNLDRILASTEHVPFWFAVGGQPIVRDGVAVAGLNSTTAATRSAAGVSADGRRLFLLALDRNAAGMTYAELADLLLSVGAAAGVNLDGGGSSTLVARDPGAGTVAVKNLAPGDFERPVPNGIGIFSHP